MPCWTKSFLFVVAALAAISSGSPVAFAEDSCQRTFDALTKVVTTPSHSYTTHTAAFLNDGKPRTSETVYAEGKTYIRVNGRWMVSPATPKEILERQEEKRKHAREACQFLRNESVNGESAMLISVHSENEGNI